MEIAPITLTHEDMVEYSRVDYGPWDYVRDVRIHIGDEVIEVRYIKGVQKCPVGYVHAYLGDPGLLGVEH